MMTNRFNPSGITFFKEHTSILDCNDTFFAFSPCDSPRAFFEFLVAPFDLLSVKIELLIEFDMDDIAVTSFAKDSVPVATHDEFITILPS